MVVRQLRRRRRPSVPEVEIFGGCNSRELDAVAQLCTPLAVLAGYELCGQGEYARQCFIVVDGRANVLIDSSFVASIGESEFIGELALLAPVGRRCATVTAATDMQLLVMSAAEFSMLQRAAPTVTHQLLREATRRLIGNAAIPSDRRCSEAPHPRSTGPHPA